MTARDIELVLATRQFPYWRGWTVVPRTYTAVPHECDLLALTHAGYAHEVEIKISLSDLKADLKKDHSHDPGSIIKCLWFAMPAALAAKADQWVPPRAGILAVHDDPTIGRLPSGWVEIRRKAEVNRRALPWGFDQRYLVARSMMFRYWQDRQKERAA
jgi:hypothetical protein